LVAAKSIKCRNQIRELEKLIDGNGGGEPVFL
jgi:hypothetical protein